MSTVIVQHPLVQHKLALMRDISTGSKDFRELAAEVSMLLAYEATRDLELQTTTVQTPIAQTQAMMLQGKKLALVAILRAGLVMVEGISRLVPAARIGHIGLYRDPSSLNPVEYYAKLPNDIAERRVFLTDPMLATGGSACEAISILKEAGAVQIRFICLLAAPEGLERVHMAHPDIEIITAAVDEGLNEHAYIVPGLGDAGDRLFGTR